MPLQSLARFDPQGGLPRSQIQEAQRVYELVDGVKHPNSKEEGSRPVRTRAWGLRESSIVADSAANRASSQSSFKELLPFVIPSPDQEEAGSCLYMSNAGIAELLNARLHPELDRRPNGPLDISERYTMNLGEFESWVPSVSDWTTDSILMLNGHHRALRNSSFRYAKSWFFDGKYGPFAAPPHAQGARYGTEANWFVGEGLPIVQAQDWIALPHFSKSVLWKGGSLWAIGVMPDDIVARAKRAMVEAKAPLQVIYNHEGYWHSVAVVGFDDDAPTGGCPILTEATESLKDSAPWWVQRVKQFGGCKERGVFYVRDSIYSDPSEPMYDYDEKQKGEERPLSKRIIVREYDWLLHLANRIVLVTAQ